MFPKQAYQNTNRGDAESFYIASIAFTRFAFGTRGITRAKARSQDYAMGGRAARSGDKVERGGSFAQG